MPPPAGFSDPANEVVCPLKNNDGSSCRKKCTGVRPPLPAIGSMLTDGQEKKYRSMQEHIRRAHPEHYIPKLPATEESFALMVNSAPHERPPPVTTHPLSTVSVPAGPVGKSSPKPCPLLTPSSRPGRIQPYLHQRVRLPPSDENLWRVQKSPRAHDGQLLRPSVAAAPRPGRIALGTGPCESSKPSSMTD
jgi:hypothetical protein